MAIIRVYTDSEKFVKTINVNDNSPKTTVGRDVTGRDHEILGTLGRALTDAQYLERGMDPERPSEKAMRLISEGKSESSNAYNKN